MISSFEIVVSPCPLQCVERHMEEPIVLSCSYQFFLADIDIKNIFLNFYVLHIFLQGGWNTQRFRLLIKNEYHLWRL